LRNMYRTSAKNTGISITQVVTSASKNRVS